MTIQDQVTDDETITHFVFHKDGYYKDGRTYLKPNVFIRPKVPGEVSVYRIDQLKDSEIWPLTKFVRTDKPVLARGDMNVVAIRKVINEETNKHLDVVADKKVHNRHANIVNLPLTRAIEQTLAVSLSRLTKTTFKDLQTI